MSRPQLEEVSLALSKTLSTRIDPHPSARVHGGCINESYQWQTVDGPIFVKIASTDRLAMFEAEVAGLKELKLARAVRVPELLTVGLAGGKAYLALEWIDFSTRHSAAEARLGEQLARQHRISAREFGWHRNNAIGSTPQVNKCSNDWVEFFRDHRLRYQFDLARRNGYEGWFQERGAELLEKMHAFFLDYRPSPSLLHGDLWGGNWAVDPNGEPVVFDPAVYYGDREADVAMTRLFAGFGSDFYRAYQTAWPLDRGAAARVPLYNLYHVLNHLNLFGSGYLSQVESMIDRLLAELQD